MSARLAPQDVVVIVGKRGSGKSYNGKQLLHLEQSAGARVVAFDPHNEYSRHGRKTKATNLGPLRDSMRLVELLERPEVLDAADLSLAVVPDPDDLGTECAEFINLVKHTGDVTVLFDEVGEYGQDCARQLNSAATQSRHWGAVGCPILFVAQRLTQIPKSAREQASTLITGLQNSPSDLALIEEITGNPKFAEAVSRLPRPGSLTWRDTSGVTTK